jgi:small basic protein
MLVADALGILVGIVMGKKIPERFIKWFAAVIFVAFGLVGLFHVAPPSLRTFPVVAGSVALCGALLAVVARLTREGEPGNEATCERDCTQKEK